MYNICLSVSSKIVEYIVGRCDDKDDYDDHIYDNEQILYDMFNVDGWIKCVPHSL